MIKFFLIIGLHIVVAEKMTPKVQVVSAISTRKILDTVVYEGSVPLILEVDIPAKVFSTQKEDCKADDVDCYFRNSIHYMYQNMEQEILILKNSTNSRPERQIVAAIAAAGGYILAPAINRITNALFCDDDVENRCNEIHVDLKDVTRKTEEYSMQMNTVMEEAKKKIMDNSNTLTRMEQTLKTAIKGIFEIVMGKSLNSQLHHGINECLDQKFPVSIVTLKKLREHLISLESVLRTKNYKIALPLDDLSVFSKIRLTDCVIKDSVLKVIINIPIVGLDTDWALFEVTHNKFAYNGQVCEVWPSEAMFVATEKKMVRTVMITRNLLRHCSPYESKICLVPQFSRDSEQSLHCVKVMLQNEPVEFLKAHCGFRCYDDEEVDIKLTAEGTIRITNAKNVTMYCGNNYYEYDIPSIGSLELRLGCTCSTFVNNIRLDNPISCVERGYYVHDHLKLSIPNVWTKLDNLLQGSKSEHRNLSHMVDSTWHSRVPVLNFTRRADKIEQDNTSMHFSFSLTGVVVICILVAIITCYKHNKRVSTLMKRSETMEMIETLLNKQSLQRKQNVPSQPN